MKVAITGASGFIGRYVVAELKRKSISPVVVLRPGGSVPKYLSGLEVACIDINSPPEDAFELMGSPDSLIHLAWGGLPHYKSNQHMEKELPTQLQFLGGLVNSGLENLVITGTCFEYGMASGCLNEEMEAKPGNPYGQAKDTLRCQLEALRKENNFSLTWARLFYLYGDGQAETSLIPQLEQAIERGDDTFNMSGGEQLRDYLAVEVVAERIVSLLETQKSNGIVNICSGEPISVRHLVERVLTEKKSTMKLNLGYYPYPDFEPMQFWGDGRYYQTIVGGE